MPFNIKKYPANWRSEIVPAILKRAGEVRNNTATRPITDTKTWHPCASAGTSVRPQGTAHSKPSLWPGA